MVCPISRARSNLLAFVFDTARCNLLHCPYTLDCRRKFVVFTVSNIVTQPKPILLLDPTLYCYSTQTYIVTRKKKYCYSTLRLTKTVVVDRDVKNPFSVVLNPTLYRYSIYSYIKEECQFQSMCLFVCVYVCVCVCVCVSVCACVCVYNKSRLLVQRSSSNLVGKIVRIPTFQSLETFDNDILHDEYASEKK